MCSRCGLPKRTSDFHVWAHAKDGRRSHCKQCESDRDVVRYQENSDAVKRRVKEWREANIESCLSKSRTRRLRIRYEALVHYSGPEPSCACCGESDYRFLTLDHVEGGGVHDRPQTEKYGGLAGWLRARGYPDGFQVLCWNCNSGKGVYGVCPHKLPPMVTPVAPPPRPPPVSDGLCSHCSQPGEFYPSRPKTCKSCVKKYKEDRLNKLRIPRLT